MQEPRALTICATHRTENGRAAELHPVTSIIQTMKRVSLVLLFLGGNAAAAEINGYLVLTSDYVFRGVTYSDGYFAAQIGGDVTFDNGVYFGAWASSIDIETPSGAERDLEVDYYLGYGLDLTDALTVGANVVAYTFPGAEGLLDYDYEEYSLSINYMDRVWFEYSYAPDIFSTGTETHNYGLFSELPLGHQIVASAGIGYYDTSALSDDSYAYWELGVTREFERIAIDLRYHDADQWVSIFSSADRVESRLVLSAKLRF